MVTVVLGTLTSQHGVAEFSEQRFQLVLQALKVPAGTVTDSLPTYWMVSDGLALMESFASKACICAPFAGITWWSVGAVIPPPTVRFRGKRGFVQGSVFRFSPIAVISISVRIRSDRLVLQILFASECVGLIVVVHQQYRLARRGCCFPRFRCG